MIMRTHRRPLAIAALSVLPSIAMAAAPSAAGDAARGATVAAPCQACHGTKGEGMVATNSPRLAAQDSYYLDKQLRDYASGLRNDPIMSPMAKTLTDQQRIDVAAYFASLPPPPQSSPNGDATLLARGHLLSRTGDESKQLQACGNCHGPDGRGEKFAAPYLDGQLAIYLTKAIAAWKDGTRKNDGGEIMAVVAARLTRRMSQRSPLTSPHCRHRIHECGHRGDTMALMMSATHADSPTAEAKRTILERHPQSGVEGKEVILGTAELPAGAVIGPHTDYGDESGYVLKSHLVLKVKGQPDRELKAGDYFFNPAGLVHSLVAEPVRTAVWPDRPGSSPLENRWRNRSMTSAARAD